MRLTSNKQYKTKSMESILAWPTIPGHMVTLQPYSVLNRPRDTPLEKTEFPSRRTPNDVLLCP